MCIFISSAGGFIFSLKFLRHVDRLVLARRSAEKTLPLELPSPWQAEFDDLEWRDLLHAGRGCPLHGFSALHHGLQAAARTGHVSGWPQRQHCTSQRRKDVPIKSE
jgi:hypothetical protein